MPALAITPGDSMSAFEIAVLVVAAFVLGFAVGRVCSLRRRAA